MVINRNAMMQYDRTIARSLMWRRCAVASEFAVGVERLSPLAVIDIGRLIAGVFLALLVIPVLFDFLGSACSGSRWRRLGEGPA